MIAVNSLQSAFIEWHNALPKRLLNVCRLEEEENKFRLDDPPKIRAISNACEEAGWSTLTWCEQNGASTEDFVIKK